MTRRRVTWKDNLGFWRGAEKAWTASKEARRMRERKGKSRGKREPNERKLSKLCFRSPGMATMDLFDFLLYYY